jgi:hypothetical protein
VQNDEADNAALTMMNHAADSWEHTEFKSVLSRCANPENLYKAVQFYVEESPLEVRACVAGGIYICIYIYIEYVICICTHALIICLYTYIYIHTYNVFQLNDLLCSLSKKEGVLDHSRVVVIMKRRLPLIKEYLEQVISLSLSLARSLARTLAK